MLDSSSILMTLKDKKIQSIRSGLENRMLIKLLSNNFMIHYIQIRTRILQGRSWSWCSIKSVSIPTCGSSLLYLYLWKTFLLKFGQIPLFMLTFVLIAVYLFLNLSRRLHRMLRREINIIFGTTRDPIMIIFRMFGNYDSNKMNICNVCYCSLCCRDSWR